jgi:uncharacterized repeat protein (TIGR01451 family)
MRIARNRRLTWTLVLVALTGIGYQWWEHHGQSGCLRSTPEARAWVSPHSKPAVEAMKFPARLSCDIKSRTPRAWLDDAKEIDRKEVSLGGSQFMQATLRQTSFMYPCVRTERVVRRDEATGLEVQISERLMVGDHVIAKPASGVSLEEFTHRSGAASVEAIKDSEYVRVKFPASTTDALPSMIARLQAEPGLCAHAEPDYLGQSCAVPNDVRFNEQWHLHNLGSVDSPVDTDIDAPEAWDITIGNRTIIVAVLDTGINFYHPDFSPSANTNIWLNPVDSTINGVDEDGNGYVDDWLGWNFVVPSGSGNNFSYDLVGHGTAVAGVIGAKGNNSLGGSGVSQQVRLMSVKCLDSNGYAPVSAMISAINYARTKGANVINHSWSTLGFSQALKDAIDAAGTAGIINVCAAGNVEYLDQDILPVYPANFASASVISVGATTRTDTLASFSGYGRNSVHLGAPGVDVLTTTSYDVPSPPDTSESYGYFSGTSIAAPQVSGIAALLKAYKSTLTVADIKRLLQSSVDHVAALEGIFITEGRANAYRALQQANDLSTLPATGLFTQAGRSGVSGASSIVYAVKNFRTTAVNYTAILTNVPWATVAPASGSLAAGASVNITVTVNQTLANAAAFGLHEGVLTIRDTTTSVDTTRPIKLDVAILSFDLSNDPGWERTGAWRYGTPIGRGGHDGIPGFDPAAGATDTKVLGANLNGDYYAQLPGIFRLETGDYDLRGYSDVSLEFMSWLNAPNSTDTPHHLEYSVDGGLNWVQLYGNNPYEPMHARAWQLLSFALFMEASPERVRFRWVYEVLPGSNAAAGWNIDDIKLRGVAGNRIFLDGISSKAENTGTAALTLHVEPPSATPLTVTLTSSVLTAATLPAIVNVPANTTSVAVTATLIDDTLRDGTQRAVLNATAAGYVSVSWNLDVTDNETATLTLNLPTTAKEGDPPIVGAVHLNAPATRDVEIPLTSSDTTAATVPSSVTILAGQINATFNVILPDNALAEGAKSSTITASMPGWTGASVVLAVSDAESQLLSVYMFPTGGSYTFAEGITPGLGVVSLANARPVETVITLALSNSSRVQFPTTVTIPAGYSISSFDGITVTDDALVNGLQTVTLTASSPGLTTVTQNVTVADNEVAGIAFDWIYSPQSLPGTVDVTLRAVDASGKLNAGFNGTATVTGRAAGVEDAEFGGWGVEFVNGIAGPYEFTLTTASANYALRAEIGSVVGTSNTFTVATRTLTHTVNAGVNGGAFAYDAATTKLWAGRSDGTIVSINPDTGAMGTVYPISATPIEEMQISGTGSVLYALVDSRTKLVRINLTTGALGTPIVASAGIHGFAILSGTTDSVLIGNSEAITLYVSGVAKPTIISGPDLPTAGQICVGSTANRAYAFGVMANKVTVLNTSATGVTLGGSYSFPHYATAGWIQVHGTTLIVDGGYTYDADTGNPLGRAFINSGSYSNAAVVDSNTNRAIFLASDTSGGSDYSLRIYETKTYSATGLLPLSLPPTGPRLLRLNGHNLAYASFGDIVLIHSGLVPAPAAAEPDLAVDQLVGPVEMVTGAPLSFSILVRNNGNAAAAGVVLTDRWPAGCIYTTTNTSQGSVTASGELVTVNLGTIAAGGTATVSVVLNAGFLSGVNIVRVTTTTAESLSFNNISEAVVDRSSEPSRYARSMLDIIPGDLAGRRTQSRLFATIGNGTGLFSGMLAVIDPVNYAVTNFLPVGSDPGPLVLADDDTTLTIGLTGSHQLISLNASTLALGTPYSIGNAADGRRLAAQSMTAVPGQPTRLIVGTRDVLGNLSGAALYQGATRIGTATEAGEKTVAATFGTSAAQLFTLASRGEVQPLITRYSVSSTTGLTKQITADTFLPTFALYFSNGELLDSNGLFYDPATLTQTTRLSAAPIGTMLDVLADSGRQRIYGIDPYSTDSFQSYDPTTHASLASFPSALDYYSYRITRWGNSGLAYLDRYSVRIINDATIVPPPIIRVMLPATASEGAGVLTSAGTVHLTEVAATNLTVNLRSSDPGILSVPASVTITAGQLSATFNLTLTNDTILNGGRPVTVVPSGPAGYRFENGTATVSDNEPATLALTMPSTFTEATGTMTGQGTISLGSAAGATLSVSLVSSDPSRVQVPASVLIPLGQSTGTFAYTLFDDSYYNIINTASVTASVPGWTTSVRNIAITDDETGQITISYDFASVPESANTLAGKVLLANPSAQSLTISLASSHPARLTIPATVFIPQGATEVNFTATITDNGLADGRQVVTSTASAAGFTTGTTQTTVQDDDIHHFIWTMPNSVDLAASFPVVVSARTLDDDPINIPSNATYPVTALRNGNTISLIGNGLTRSGTDLTSLTGTFSINTVGANTTLSFIYNSVTSTSPPFMIASGPIKQLLWDAIPVNGPQPNAPYPVTIRAADVLGNFRADFTGTANISAQENVISIPIGSGTSTNSYGISTYTNNGRISFILTPSEIGRGGMLRSLSLNLVEAPVLAYSSHLIRLKHTTQSFLNTWDSQGYSIVRQGPLNLTGTTGWVDIPFANPFSYDGVSSLLVDLSFSNPTRSPGGSLQGNGGSAIGGVANFESNTGPPEGWGVGPGIGVFAYGVNRPNVRLESATPLSVTPPTTGNFVNGIWTGNLTFPNPAMDVQLIATSNTTTGISNIFQVGVVPPAAPVLVALPAYSSSLSQQLNWAAVPRATAYFVELATEPTFATPVPHPAGWITQLAANVSTPTDNTHYYFRVKARVGITDGPWSNVVDSILDNSNPRVFIKNEDITTISGLTTVLSSQTLVGSYYDATGITGINFQLTPVGSTAIATLYPDKTWSRTITLNSLITYTLKVTCTDLVGHVVTRDLPLTRLADLNSDGLPDSWAAGYGLSNPNAAPTADPDKDGRVNLLEYAFNSSPLVANGPGPALVAMPNPADGQSYLTFAFDRRRGHLDLTYSPEFSANLAQWSSTLFTTESISATMNPDGITERVTIRIKPAQSQLPAQIFIRLRVTNAAP